MLFCFDEELAMKPNTWLDEPLTIYDPVVYC